MTRMHWLAMLIVVVLISGARSAEAAGPHAARVVPSAPSGPDYLILQTPQSWPPAGHSPGFYPGRGHGVSTNAYAYGWFGAAPRRHWSRHFGYYRNYTQWSRR